MILRGKCGEFLALLVITLTVTLVSSVPYFVAFSIEPPDRHFMGIISNVPDWAQYFAWLKAFEKAPIIENPLTSEPQQPTFFNIQWFALAQIKEFFNLTTQATVQLFRIVNTLVFMWLTFFVCYVIFPVAPWIRWSSWILINLSSGLGWIWVIEKRISGELRYPLDVYVAEPISFQNMIIYPHFLFAASLILLIFWAYLEAAKRSQYRYVALGGVLALLLSLSHAYDLIIVYGVLFTFSVILFIRDPKQARFLFTSLCILTTLSAAPAAYFYILTTTDPLWKNILIQFANASVFTPDPLHLLILVGLPLILTIITYDGVFPLVARSHWNLLLRTWMVVNFFLLYIPADYQIHMLSGWQIPLGILASDGLFNRLLPAIGVKGVSQVSDLSSPEKSTKFARRRWGLVLLILISILPTNVYLLLWRVREVQRLEHTHFLHHDEINAIEWLARNTDASDVVLADLIVGQHIPGISGNKVYLGHWAQTPFFVEKQQYVESLYALDPRDDLFGIKLNEMRVNYMLFTREKPANLEIVSCPGPFLELVFSQGPTHLCRVVQPGDMN